MKTRTVTIYEAGGGADARTQGRTLSQLVINHAEAHDEVKRIHDEFRACRCEYAEKEQREHGKSSGDWAPVDEPGRDEWGWLMPCWKGQYVDGDWWSVGGARSGGWCAACKRREALREPLRMARLRRGGHRAALIAAGRRLREAE